MLRLPVKKAIQVKISGTLSLPIENYRILNFFYKDQVPLLGHCDNFGIFKSGNENFFHIIHGWSPQTLAECGLQ